MTQPMKIVFLRAQELLVVRRRRLGRSAVRFHRPFFSVAGGALLRCTARRTCAPAYGVSPRCTRAVMNEGLLAFSARHADVHVFAASNPKR